MLHVLTLFLGHLQAYKNTGNSSWMMYDINHLTPSNTYLKDVWNNVCMSEHMFSYVYITGQRVELSLCLIKHHAIRTYGGKEVQFHTLLISVLDGSESSAPEPGHLTPRDTDSGMHLIGAYVDPRDSLDTGEAENLSPARNQTLIPWSCNL
jgi:hypothetical protein